MRGHWSCGPVLVCLGLVGLGAAACEPFSKGEPLPEGTPGTTDERDSSAPVDSAEPPPPDIQSWRGTRSLTDPELAADARYGYALASVDSNGDGEAELFVGAYKTMTHGDRAGQVWRYPRLEAEAKEAVDPPGPHTLQRFGARLVSLGDADGDGYDDLAVTAVGDHAEGERAGAVYLLYGSPNGPDRARDQRLTGSAPAPGREYGSNLATLGDVDGDGAVELVVGNPAAAEEAGTVDVWRGGLVPELTTVSAPEGETAPFFGSSVAGGDLDGDGYGELLVGMVNGRATHAWHFPDGGLAGVPARAVELGGGPETHWPVLGRVADLDGDGAADLTTRGFAGVQLGSAEGLSGAPVALSVEGLDLNAHLSAIVAGQGLLVSDKRHGSDVGVGLVWWWPDDALTEPGVPVVPPEGVYVGCFGSDFAQVGAVLAVGDSCSDEKRGQVVLFEAGL